MFNLIAPIVLALAMCATLGSQLASTAYRNTQLPRCAGCQLPLRDLSTTTARANRAHHVES